MSTNLLVFLIALFSALALIYMIYTILLDSSGPKKKKELLVTPNGILEHAKILFKQKKYKLVEKLAYKYLEIKPEHNELRLILAKSLYNEDSIYDAIKEAMIILTKDENNSDAHFLLARCYKKVNQPTKAISELQEIMKQDPDNMSAAQELSNLYVDLGQKESAIKALKHLESLTKNNGELLQIKTTLANLYIEIENYPEAFDELNEILEIYPEDTDTNKKLIELYIKVQNYESAIETCESLLAVNENNSLSLWLLNNLVNLYYLTKNIDKTIEYAKKLLEHPFSDKLKTRIYIAKILISSDKEQEGLKLLNELSEKNNENIEIKRLLIDTYLSKNNFVAAIDLYKQIVDLVNPMEIKSVHTEMSNVFAKWAKYQFEKRELNECFKTFTLAIQYDNANPEIYYELGLVNYEIKNFNEAIIQLKKAININANKPKYHMAIADCYQAIGNTFEQKDSLLAAINIDENNTIAYFKLAMLYDGQHDKASEIHTLEKILEIEPQHLDAKYQLALILESQGNKEKALELYREIERVNYDFKNVQKNIDMLISNE